MGGVGWSAATIRPENAIALRLDPHATPSAVAIANAIKKTVSPRKTVILQISVGVGSASLHRFYLRAP